MLLKTALFYTKVQNIELNDRVTDYFFVDFLKKSAKIVKTIGIPTYMP